MATSHSPASASCISYGVVPASDSPEPPELDYKFFSPEFLDELEEHYAAMAVGQLPA
ncbi:hypothetical protein Achl_4432 (plasmid) [Pseudarthrobacter chlorophenolicus A6]|uniref:Uncharacterized protein n=1 Tax=Pseudarthrobacter chlorophenolicus (strain ATCC 700700 / DSM 12829 / CIP 107037 / JCM 12360 / KCTC 9906 / NCIMB 13794 / A6) TaxID=452863 RepID=B8HIY6_PSECP|nr:hypothetical protein [Pseudarthrobacter chlorophenolicus]ACL42383.1 hypothetical protein Achl_4432 [Pseudarthrobacter chlorophenolicus A6]SDQ17375.1 hypothetical protein SAMN04489738_0489 [Pseudarthrobacter chlorophenolicus]